MANRAITQKSSGKHGQIVALWKIKTV